MDKTVDPFWGCVGETNDGTGRKQCVFCKHHKFAKGTSIWRIKCHLSGERGRSVAICDKVPKEVQEAAFQALFGARKKQKSLASSSNVDDNAMPTVPHEQNNEIDIAGGLLQSQGQGMEQRVEEARTSPIAVADHHMENSDENQMTQIDRSISPERCMVDAQETQGDAIQTTDFVSQIDLPWKDFLMNIESHLMEEDVEKGTGTLLQPAACVSSSRGLPHNTSNKTKGDVFPISSTRVVGEAFEEKKKAIWSWLMNDEFLSIGIHGMGGVGKSTLAKHINNDLLKESNTFSHVCWITVSQDFSINGLQNLVANRFDLVLSDKDDELHRAAKLSKALIEKEKWVLILDDLWGYVDIDRVGVPAQAKGCKLIVTTRSLKVCHRMGCQETIKLEPLSRAEAWTLFIEKFGHDKALSHEVEQIAKSITRECDGLPLGITTMAGTMRRVVDICEWRNALEELKESKARKDDMEPDVFKILKFSYNNLNDSTLQQCFSYCALFPEDYKIDRQMLILFLIDEGIIEGMQSLVAKLDKGHSMLNKLEDVCLLESCQTASDHRAVKMHDLIRDMALQILQENSHVMVKAGKQLKELPDVEEWNANLERVSLMANDIIEIPHSHAPRCSYLANLLICSNYRLRFIADSFFNQFHNLKVLDLSYTSIEMLPDSVSNLVTLNGLLLRGCGALRCVPSLKKLKTLRRLDLGGTVLENFPNVMEWLSNLRCLRVGEFVGKFGQKEFPVGILPKLSRLRVFIQEYPKCQEHVEFGAQLVCVKGKEVACLRKLEILQCYFEHLSDLGEYVKSRDESQPLSSYALYVGFWDPFEPDILEDYDFINKSVGLCGLSISKDRDFQLMFPNDMKIFRIYRCDDATSLCDVSSSIQNATELEVIDIRSCYDMESLLSCPWFYSAPPEPPPSHGLFPRLKKLICYMCVRMKKLFPLNLLSNLVNLEEISVESCHNLEEIIATTDDNEVEDMGEECGSSSSYSSYSIAEFSLPKLRSLDLLDLPELESICTAKLKCDSLEEICVWHCEKLKRMPISLPLLDPSLRKIEMDNETWESMEWDHPNAKGVFLPFVNFLP